MPETERVKMSLPLLMEKKRKKEKITMITSYTCWQAYLVDKAGIDIVLVGDSLSMTELGNATTLPVSMDTMVVHAAVTRSCKSAFVLSDMPYMTSQPSNEIAVKNAGRFMAESSCDGIKLPQNQKSSSRQGRALVGKKVSIFAGHANAAGGKVLQSLGANTFNPAGDLSLPALAAIRQIIGIPLDLHVYLSDSFGGFNRFYDVPEMARLCAPCYYKIEPGTTLAGGSGIYRPWTPAAFHAEMCREKVKYAQIIHEIICENFATATMSERGAADLAIPKP